MIIFLKWSNKNFPAFFSFNFTKYTFNLNFPKRN